MIARPPLVVAAANAELAPVSPPKPRPAPAAAAPVRNERRDVPGVRGVSAICMLSPNLVVAENRLAVGSPQHLLADPVCPPTCSEGAEFTTGEHGGNFLSTGML